MPKKCDYELCQNNRTKLFFDWFSGLRKWVYDDHFDLLQKKARQERARYGYYEEQEPLVFDENLAAVVRGKDC